MSNVQYDRVFTGRQAGGGENDISNATGHRFYIPSQAANRRLKRYDEAARLLDPEEHHAVYQDEKMRNGSVDEQEHWIPLDFPGMLSRLMRQYTLGEEYHVRAVLRGEQGVSGVELEDRQIEAQREVDRITKRSRLPKLFRQVAEQLPVYGDGVVRVDVEDAEDPTSGQPTPQALVRYVRPHHYFPEIDPLDSSKVSAVTLAWVLPRAPGASELMVLRERHEPGTVSYSLNEWDGSKLGGEIPFENTPAAGLKDRSTGIDEIPVVHFGYQVKAGEHFGSSEILRVRRLVLALENRLAQEDEVLEKHARPKLVVGPGILDDTGRANLKDFDVIEVTPDIFEKAVQPDYLTWDMQVTGIQHEIEKLEEYLFMTTETSPASFGLERDGSQVESARALRFKAHRTVNKVNDLREEMGPQIEAVYRIAQKLELAARKARGMGDGYRRSDIRIKFGDPIVEDQTQEVQDYAMRKQSGLVSRRRALMDLDNLTAEEADAEVERILQDQVDESAASTATLQPVGIEAEAAGAPPGLGEPTEEPAPAREPEPAPAREIGESELGIAEDVQKVVLNGAQVASMVTIATQVAKKELPKESALAIIEIAFGLPRSEAERILAGTEELEAPKQPARPMPPSQFGFQPADEDEEDEAEA